MHTPPFSKNAAVNADLVTLGQKIPATLRENRNLTLVFLTAFFQKKKQIHDLFLRFRRIIFGRFFPRVPIQNLMKRLFFDFGTPKNFQRPSKFYFKVSFLMSFSILNSRVETSKNEFIHFLTSQPLNLVCIFSNQNPSKSGTYPLYVPRREIFKSFSRYCSAFF